MGAKAKDETGKRYGHLAVLRRSGSNRYGATWLCRCDCGKETVVLGKYLRKGWTISCGCRRKKDETGHEYGRLTVISEAEERKGGHIAWLCQCDCGNQVVVSGRYLRDGSSKSCGCLRAELGRRNVIDEIGNRYGKLLVVDRRGIRNGLATWLCRCDCGGEAVVTGTLLRIGHVKSCGCLSNFPDGEAAFNGLLKSYIKAAMKRGYEWGLTTEQFRSLTKGKCYYCACEPSQVHRPDFPNGGYTYNGLDRKDNSKSYTLENTVSCCGTCNKAKMTMTVKEFLEWITQVYEHNKGGEQ